MASKYLYKEIEVDLCEFDTEDLLEELDSRGAAFNPSIDGEKVCNLLYLIWQKRRTGVNFDSQIDQLIWEGIGKVV